MKHTAPPTPDEILQAIASIQRNRPSYQEILDFYGKVAVAQTESAHQIDPGLIENPGDLFEMKIKEGFPLLTVNQFVIDKEASGALLLKLCNIAMQTNQVMADSANKIKAALDDGSVTVNLLFHNLVSDTESSKGKTFQDIQVNPDVLSFLTYNSTLPSVLRCVEHLMEAAPEETVWETKGICPICGGAPGMSALGKEGKRFLVCHFCRYEWSVPRGGCHFCGNEDRKTMKYFYSDEEPEYRVDTCDQCKTYLKTVDTRELDRIFYLPIEQVATLHLDLTAQEKGFHQPAFIA